MFECVTKFVVIPMFDVNVQSAFRFRIRSYPPDEVSIGRIGDSSSDDVCIVNQSSRLIEQCN
jgi:hypothetical protein